MSQDLDTPTVKQSFSGALQRVLSLLWIRRHIILVPLLVSIPLALAMSYLLPRSYVATTLLLLQESNGGPLSVNTTTLSEKLKRLKIKSH